MTSSPSALKRQIESNQYNLFYTKEECQKVCMQGKSSPKWAVFTKDGLDGMGFDLMK